MKTKDLVEKAKKLNIEKKHNEVIDLLPIELLEKHKNADLYAEKAMALWRTDQYDDCELMAHETIKLDNYHAKGYNYLGHIYGNKKDYEKAKEYYLKAIEIDPKYSNPHEWLGYLYLDLKDYVKAIVYYLKAIEIDPKNSYPYYGIGKVYSYLIDNKRAIEYFLKAIEIDPKYSSPYYELGVIYKNLKKYEKAKEYYLKVVEIDPKNSYSYNGLGSVYFQLKDYEKAKEYYLKALEIDPKFSYPNYNLGLLYFDIEEFELAKESFEKYIELDPNKNNTISRIALTKIEEIDKILGSSSYEKVKNLIEKIKEMLLFSGNCITHYTSISTVQLLVLVESSMRLSEGSFLNDTAEGQELFSYLAFGISNNTKQNEEIFTKRPFIGSFVDAEKNNDLTLWRMYGKEALEEAKGCSVTIDAVELKQKLIEKIMPIGSSDSSKIDTIDFYRVAYRNGNKFDFAGSDQNQKETLNKHMVELNDAIKKFKKKKYKLKNEEINIVELLNTIAYLFKSVEYQYENEIRLVINEAIGFDKKIDFKKEDFKPSSNPPKVFIELVPISSLIKSITIGPKVNKAEEWASTFHYHLLNNNLKPEIYISKLPFK